MVSYFVAVCVTARGKRGNFTTWGAGTPHNAASFIRCDACHGVDMDVFEDNLINLTDPKIALEIFFTIYYMPFHYMFIITFRHSL